MQNCKIKLWIDCNHYFKNILFYFYLNSKNPYHRNLIHNITPTPVWKRFSDLVVQGLDVFPANTRRWTSVGLMLAHRLRRWANLKPALFQCSRFCWVMTCTYYIIPDDRPWTSWGQTVDLLHCPWNTRWNVVCLYRAISHQKPCFWNTEIYVLWLHWMISHQKPRFRKWKYL